MALIRIDEPMELKQIGSSKGFIVPSHYIKTGKIMDKVKYFIYLEEVGGGVTMTPQEANQGLTA